MIELGLALLLLIIGYYFGGAREKKHYDDLISRENQLLTRVPVRSDPGPKLSTGDAFLVSGSVVVASDYFKNFVGTIQSFFGGRLKSYESLLDRARREAVCRLRESALKQGAYQVVDLHVTTSFIDAMGVEVTAYGTAIR